MSKHNKGLKDPANQTGVSSGVAGNTNIYADNVKLHNPQGHGFAAENANNMVDTAMGKRAKVNGNNNIKGGPDRTVNGQLIQSKYCKSGAKCIEACFENGKFKYPGQVIEVPADKYDAAVKAMRSRIANGQVPGVTNPDKASELVRKGYLTYDQALAMAKAGTIQSITYDTVRGIQVASAAFGLSAIVTFAMARWQGESLEVALERAILTGLQVGGVTLATSVLTAQLGRTGLEQALRPLTDYSVKCLSDKATHFLVKGVQGTAGTVNAHNVLSKLLRGNLITGVVVTGILSSGDVLRLINGRISPEQTFKNIATTASGVAGGGAGWMGGAAAGAIVGSVVPLVGTSIGAFVGGIAGAFFAGSAAQAITSAVLDKFIEDDANAMLRIINNTFKNLALNFLLNEDEINAVSDALNKEINLETLRDMYASSNHADYALRWLNPLVQRVISKRSTITILNDDSLATASGHFLKKLLSDQAFSAKQL